MMDIATFETGITTTILGFGTVFAILLIICLVLYIFGGVVSKFSKPEQTKIITPPQPKPVVEKIETVEEELVDNKELIAVITAAICASMGGNVSPDKLVVRSLRRVKNSAWKNGVILEQQTNNF